MRVLVACEFSGTVRDAFNSRGHHAISCDLLPTQSSGIHYQGDIKHLLEGWEPVIHSAQCFPDDTATFTSECQLSRKDCGECQCIGPTMEDEVEYKTIDDVLLGRPLHNPQWDLMIAFPPCTYLCSSGLHWNTRIPGRDQQTQSALDFVRMLLDAPIPRIAIENPVGRISTAIRKPDQSIQPWQFGHDASKQTCLWLKNLPKLLPTKICKKQPGERYANQTPSGQNKLGPSPDRALVRSITYQGIAEAMADQWGW